MATKKDTQATATKTATADKTTVAPTRKTARNPKATIESVKTDVKDAVSTAADTAVAALETTRAQSKQAVETAAQAGSAAVQSSQDMVVTAHSEFTDLVRKNPTAMVVGALGVGVLLGLAMRRNS